MLELVERFEDLRVSDVVVVPACHCGGRHRGVLIGVPAEGYFEFTPKPSCVPDDDGIAVISRAAVAAKKVFRERLPDVGVTEESAATKPKERVLEDVGTRRGR